MYIASVGLDVLLMCEDRCGLSDGNLLTLGWNENKDIDHIIRYIREEYEFIDPQRYELRGLCFLDLNGFEE